MNDEELLARAMDGEIIARGLRQNRLMAGRIRELESEVKALRNSLRAAEMVVDAAEVTCGFMGQGNLPSLEAAVRNYNDHCREVPNEAG